ncbi:MAG TPA: 1-deoxy-D-xylulose-5-phosphate reductoisomerase [bacterium]|nr:1-deoxy-D-xylulose-5-phosphate reductoisomerase [bacterium]
MKRLVLLGSTGSVGRQTLEVAAHLGEVEVVALSTRRNIDLLAVQAEAWRPEVVAVEDRDAAARLRARMGARLRVLEGAGGLAELAALPRADLVLVAVVGVAGLSPTLAALRAGRDVALATKEALVAGGALVTAEAERSGAVILPVDSEHSAILQCLSGIPREEVRRIILTASGGPFGDRPPASVYGATPEEALSHPTWKMGKKISVDSATLMNKGFEVIEARWLFDLPPERIDVVIHPQSLVHGMVELIDGSILAQVAPPDMRLPIQYALTYPRRRESPMSPLRWDEGKGGVTMTFARPDAERFPALALAYHALAAGGTMPAVLNGANEAAVELFLDRRVPFGEIAALVRRTLDAHRTVASPNVDEILVADAWAREAVTRFGVEVRA